MVSRVEPWVPYEDHPSTMLRVSVCFQKQSNPEQILNRNSPRLPGNDYCHYGVLALINQGITGTRLQNCLFSGFAGFDIMLNIIL